MAKSHHRVYIYTHTRKTLVISLETMRKSKGNAIFPVGRESV